MSLKTPINNGLSQTDLDMALFKLKNANLSDYPGAGMAWNPTTKQLDVTAVPGGITGTGAAGQVTKWAGASSVFGSFWPGEFLCVKDPPYNAKGDGTTDDTAAIQQAVFDVASANGGTVFFPKGIYLCNQAPGGGGSPFNPFYDDILHIPVRDSSTQFRIQIQLLGENYPAYIVATSFDNSSLSTILTTRDATGSTTAYPALLAGDQPHAPGVIPYANLNNTVIVIRNMSFILPDNPAINALRLNGMGAAVIENSQVWAGSATVQPTHGTCGFWLPASQNFATNNINNTYCGGFDTCYRTGEHLRAPNMMAANCLTAVEFMDGIYPSWIGGLQMMNSVNGIKWTGQHPVDMMFETEHAPSGWWSVSHDITDPSNKGTGLVRYFIGQGGAGNPSIIAAVQGGSHLVLTNLGAGMPV